MLDAGSGGGSPAIPLKLAASRIALRMVEAKTRKSAFLREAVRVLDLSDVIVETARVEQLLPRPDLHEAVDVVTLRAVRIEERLLLTLQAFLKPGGEIFLFSSAGRHDKPLPPPLSFSRSIPLIESLRSQLVVLSKSR